jgi:hypothetical protein
MEVREKEKKKKGHQESREQRRHWIATKLFEWAIYTERRFHEDGNDLLQAGSSSGDVF